MNRYFSSDFKLGILGGGQLGKMLLTETRKMDINTSVMDSSAEAPARFACNNFVQGDILNAEEVFRFGKDLDAITVEIENVSVDGLKRLQEHGVKVNPSPKVLQITSNKIVEKKFYVDNGFATSPFSFFNDLISLKETLQNGRLELPFVWKSASLGYDGKGVKVIRSARDLDALSEGSCLAEHLVDIEKELSIIVNRRASGEMKTFPLVEMEFNQSAHLVELVICPARVMPSVERQAQHIAEELAIQLDLNGTLAIEFFLDNQGNLLINETAPRTHNSGHISIENNYTSQFEQHIRSVVDLPLGSTKTKCPAAMINLVGEEGHEGPVHYEGAAEVLKQKGASLHVYGKKETRPFRKMGHITLVGEDLNQVVQDAREMKEKIRVLSTRSMLF